MLFYFIVIISWQVIVVTKTISYLQPVCHNICIWKCIKPMSSLYVIGVHVCRLHVQHHIPKVASCIEAFLCAGREFMTLWLSITALYCWIHWCVVNSSQSWLCAVLSHYLTRGKLFSLKKSISCRDGSGKKKQQHGNEVGIKTQKKPNLIQRDGWEERQKEYPTSVELSIKCVEQM